ncbi:DMT family transporter [Marinomonas sp. IMCC 4694]|uniref:DMT family transporter n=1 Tax=Marinomonas sp. IMCC 4694 TaxID=2605432 RepID=UPI0011E68BAD|nr:DMT family transporter [Marinomonas sp. IMCC 4694]TYL46718.1 DMT family transporter [Marinomonas sp. IMCC 4694]
MSDTVQTASIQANHYRTIATGGAFQLGVFVAFVTACIWASWLVSVKIGVQSALTTFDLALMRYLMAGMILLPFLYRARRLLLTVPKWTLFGIVFGAGVPFFFLSSTGMHYAPVSHAGLLIPGTFPLFVSAIAVVVFKESLSRIRLLGLFAIMVGVVALLLISLWSLEGEVWKGDLWFIGSSFFFAVYTVSLRVAGLPPLAATGLLGLVSTLFLLILLATGVVTSGMNLVSTDTLIGQFFIQSVLVGLGSGFSYGYAINVLGAERTAAMGALTPVLASLLAIPLLDEPIGIAAAFGLCFVCLGVVFASGMVKSAGQK